MPAPVPIYFAADNAPLLQLAAAVGRARSARRNREQAMARDAGILQQSLQTQAANRAATNAFRANQYQQELGQQQAQAQASQQQSALMEQRQHERAMQAAQLANDLDRARVAAAARGAGTTGQSRGQRALTRATRTAPTGGHWSNGVFTPPGAAIPDTGEFQYQGYDPHAARTIIPDDTHIFRDATGARTGYLTVTGGPGTMTSAGLDQPNQNRVIPRGGFVRAGTAPMAAEPVDPETQARLNLINNASHLTPEARQRAHDALTAGATTGQLLDLTERSEEDTGLSLPQLESELFRLQRQHTRFEEDNIGDDSREMNVLRAKMAAQRRSLEARIQQMKRDNPRAGRSIASPTVEAQGKPLTPTDIAAFMAAANNDPAKATQMARAAGFHVPE